MIYPSSVFTPGLKERAVRLAFLAIILLAATGAVRADAYFNVGSFTKATGGAPATQNINHGLVDSGGAGVTPKAIIFWMEGRTNSGAFGASYLSALGLVDQSRAGKSGAAGSQDNVGTSNASRRVANKAITIIQWGETLLAEADVSAWNGTTFTLNWTTNNNQPYVIHFLAMGGTDILSKAVNWTMPAATGDVQVTGVGFLPDLVLHVHTGSGNTGAVGTNSSNAALGFGVMDANNHQWMNTFISQDAQTPPLVQRAQLTNACLTSIDSGGNFTKIASYKSMDIDGFTTSFTTVNNTNQGQVVSLALQGLSNKPGSFNKTASPTNTQTISNVGFTPSVMMFSSFQNGASATPIAEGRFGIGASNVTNERSAAFTERNSPPGNSEVDGINKTTKAFMKVNTNSPAAVEAEADLTSMAATSGGSFTLNWTTNDAAPTEILFLALAPSAATKVDLTSFTARRSPQGTLLEWRTGYEVDNLGFHLYREVNGRRQRISPSLIAGSAFLAGSGVRQTGHAYQWRDDLPGSGTVARYWLEDVDLRGQRTWHGPVIPVEGDRASQERAQAPLLSRLGNPATQTEGVSARSPDETQTESAAQPEATPRSRRASLTAPTTEQLETQWALAAGAAVKLSIRQEGWYRIRQADLIAAGLDPATDPHNLQLFVDGRQQPILVTGEEDGRFDATDGIEFYGTGLDTASTDTRVYWLVQGEQPGMRIQVGGRPERPRSPAPGAIRPSRIRGAQVTTDTGSDISAKRSFQSTVERKDHLIYFAALRNGDAENIFGPPVTSEPVERSVTLGHLDPAAPADATLEVSIQGSTETDGLEPNHQVRVSLNGHEAGEMKFSNRELATVQFQVPQAWLREGGNVVRLVTSSGSEDDVSLLAALRITYWRTYTAEADTLQFTATGGERVLLEGFSTPAVRVLDVTRPEAVEELRVRAEESQSGSAISVAVTQPGQRKLIAFAEGRTAAPADFHANQPSRWHEPDNRAEVVMIAPRYLLPTLAPLKALRESQGRTVAEVALEDIYDEFNFGAKSPEAIKEFLRRASTTWQQQPRFVLLVGDASYDPRNYLGLENYDLLPTKMIATAILETASDDWFGDFDDDGLSELAIGRLPVRTSDEAETLVAKIVGYEQGSSGGRNDVLLVSDYDEVVNFASSTTDLRSLLPETVNVEELSFNENSDAAAKAELLAALNHGPLIANFLGHGSLDVWSRREIFSASDARALTNGQRLSFYVSMTCLNGFFHDIYTESLAEAVLKSPNGGAIAAWASSAVVGAVGQEQLDQELFRRLFSDQSLTIGEAVMRAKAGIQNPDLRRTWILFGDPVTKLRR